MIQDWMYLLVIGAGFLAGFINTLAGSGSLITLPLLIFLGLPANVANGTNRVAILFQNIVGVSRFHQEKVLDLKNGKRLLIPSILGAIIGAQIAVEINVFHMKLAIMVLMMVMLIIILLKPNQWLQNKSLSEGNQSSWWEGPLFFFVGVYGGFIQAGVGIFLLSALVLGAGFDLVRANAVKLLIVLVFTPFALVVFLWNDQVNWKIGLILAVGNMAGAWVGTKTAVRGGVRVVRMVLIAVISLSLMKLALDLWNGS